MKKRKNSIGRRLLAVCLAILFTLTSLPVIGLTESKAITDASYSWTVRIATSTDKDSGTDGSVHFLIRWVDESGTTHEYESDALGGHGNDFENGDKDDYDFTINQDFDPWQIVAFGFYVDGGFWGDDWKCGGFTVYLPNGGGSLTTTRKSGFLDDESEWWYVSSDFESNAFSTLARNCTYSQFFDNQEIHLRSNNNNAISLGNVEINIKDQYSSGYYNPWDRSFPPQVSVDILSQNGTTSLSKSQIYSLEQGSSSNRYSLNTMGNLYNRMVENGLGSIGLKVSGVCKEKSYGSTYKTQRNPEVAQREIWIYRDVFSLDIPSSAASMDTIRNQYFRGTPTISSSQENGDFYITGREVIFRTSVNSIYQQNPSSSSKINSLATLFADQIRNGTGTVKLYKGNGQNREFLCDMEADSSTTGRNLTFKGTLPENYESGGVGISLEFDFSDEKVMYEGRSYELQIRDQKDIVTQYFSSLKIDQKAPTLQKYYRSDDADREYTELETLKKTHKVVPVFSEQLYRDGIKDGTALATYRIRKEGEEVDTKILTISGTQPSALSQEMPVFTTADKENAITLALDEPKEGIFNLTIESEDVAHNKLTETRRIYLDNKAPEASTELTTRARSLDGTRSMEVNFKVSDYSGTGRVNYCFVKDGNQVPDPGSQMAEIPAGVTEGQWCFVKQNSLSGTTSTILQIPKEEEFTGTLYYYTVDDMGNDSRKEKGGMDSVRVELYNKTGEGTVQFGVAKQDEGKQGVKNYVITPNYGDNTKFCYYYQNPVTLERTKVMDAVTLSENAYQPGSGSVVMEDGKQAKLDGAWSFVWCFENLSSKIPEDEHRKTLIFDNKEPEGSVRWESDHTVAAKRQTVRIQISDSARITEAGYYLDDGEENRVSLPVNAEGKVHCVVDVEPNTDTKNKFSLRLWAKDENGHIYDAVPDDAAYYIAGTPDAEISVDSEASWQGVPVINDKNKIIITANSNFRAEDYTGLHAQVSYSTDGLIWNDWQDVENLEFVDGQFKGSVAFDQSQIRLYEGVNTIYAKARTYHGDQNPNTSQTVVCYTSNTANPPSLRIYYDTKAPEYKLEYSKTERTNEDVELVLTVWDELTETDGLRVSSECVDLVEDEEVPGRYTATLTENVSGEIAISDSTGNQVIVPVEVNWIDKSNPEISAESQEIVSGDRKDGEITVTASGMTEIQFGLVPVVNGALPDDVVLDGALNPVYIEYFQNPKRMDSVTDDTSRSYIQTTEVETGRDGAERDMIYHIKLRGLTGEYALAVKASDELGNSTVSADLCRVVLLDAQAELKEFGWKETADSETALLPDRNVAMLTFSAPVYIFSENEEEVKPTEFKTLWEIQTEKPEIKKITYMDELYRYGEYELDSTKAVREGGNQVLVSLTKNEEPVVRENGEWLGVLDTDRVQVTLKLDETQHPQGGYLWVEDGAMEGFTVNEEKSVPYTANTEPAEPTETPEPEAEPTETPEPEAEPTETPEPEAEPTETPEPTDAPTPEAASEDSAENVIVVDETTKAGEDQSIDQNTDRICYETLVLDMVQNAEAHKISYHSCVYGVDGTGTSETHVYYLMDVDNTAPTFGDYQYSNSAPTNHSVEVRIPVEDLQSGIASVTTIDENGNTVQAYDGNGMAKDVFAENGSRTYTVTNGAGLTSEFTVEVTNINKEPLTEADYSVTYYYTDYEGEDKVASPQEAYRSVRAVVVPASEREFSILNNGGSNEITLYDSREFCFQLMDTYGNQAEVTVGHTLYDNTPPVIAVEHQTTEQTNKPVKVKVTVTDQENGGALSYCEAVAVSDGAECQTLVPVGNGEYELEVGKNGKYMIRAYDLAGNYAQTTFTVSNINIEPPVLNKEKIVLTPEGFTRRQVEAKLEFWSNGEVNARVTIIKVEPVSGVTSEDFTVEGNTIIFDKNGSVTIWFEDAYGNQNTDVVTVTNIVKEAPNVVPVVETAADGSEAVITFQQQDKNGNDISQIGDEYGRMLSDFTVSSGILDYSKGTTADKATLVASENGIYQVSVSDIAGNTQNFAVKITGIERKAAKIEKVEWSYEYPEKNSSGQYEMKSLLDSYVVKEGEKSLLLTSRKADQSQIQNAPATNQDVKVTVTTDMPVTQVGSSKDASTTTSMDYTEDGTFSFNLEAVNKNITQYLVNVDLIDKKPPVIELKNPELVFVEGAKIEADMYKKELLTEGLNVYDLDKDGTKIPIDLNSIEISYGDEGHVFDPDDMTKNEFDRTKPYYITYTARDAVGNETSFVQTVTLVGRNDTVALINGRMPSVNNSLTAHGGQIAVTLKNHGGKSYIKYEKGFYTMGEMKSRGTMMPLVGTVPTLTGLSSGWYTVSVQTDKKDYFTIQVYVAPVDKSSGEEKK